MIANIHRGTRKAYWRLLAAVLALGMLGVGPTARAGAVATLPEHLQGTYKIELAMATVNSYPVLRDSVTANYTVTLGASGLEGVDIAGLLKKVLGSQTVVTLEPENVKDTPERICRVVTGSFYFDYPYATHPLMRLTVEELAGKIYMWISGAAILTIPRIPPPHQEYMYIRIVLQEDTD